MPKKPKHDTSPGDLLDLLEEEAIEIAKELIKLRRFGNKIKHEDGTTNKIRAIQEVGDLLVILDMIQDAGIFSTEEIEAAKGRKRKKMSDLFGLFQEIVKDENSSDKSS